VFTQWIHGKVLLILIAGIISGLSQSSSSLPTQTDSGASRWETEIKSFEASDQTNPPPKGAILFIGSSSFRLWKTLARDFPGHRVINRGFGGSQLADSVAFAGRIVIPYQPRMILLYAGDNDIAVGKTPDQVCSDFKTFVEKVHAALPGTRIAYVSIKPSIARLRLLEKMKAANELIKDYARKQDKLMFIDIFTPMLGPNAEPRKELFISDGLHLNAKGYELWTSVIKPCLGEAGSEKTNGKSQ